MPKQALGGIPLDFGIVMEDKLSELSCTKHSRRGSAIQLALSQK